MEFDLSEKPHYKATILNNIGSFYDNSGDYGTALNAYQQCLKIQENNLDANYIFYAASLNSIGTVYLNLGRYEEAL